MGHKDEYSPLGCEQEMIRKILDFHGGDYEECPHLRCYAV
jgi:hypothetical protein